MSHDMLFGNVMCLDPVLFFQGRAISERLSAMLSVVSWTDQHGKCQSAFFKTYREARKFRDSIEKHGIFAHP